MPLFDAYKNAGVDIRAGDVGSRILYEASKQTWNNRAGRIGAIEEDVSHFFSLRASDLSGLPVGTVGGHNQDGVGTKIEVAERVGMHRTIAFDLLAMVCDDAAARGAEPILFGSTLSFSKINTDVIDQLAAGLVEAAKCAGVAVSNGELAELGSRVQGFQECSYNWEGTVFWLANRDRLFRYENILIGHSIVALREKGFRSNGLSLVRKILHAAHGKEWHNEPFHNSTLGQAVLTPSIVYSALLVELSGGVSNVPACNLSACAHITGGGVVGKLKRALLPSRLGASLTNPFPPPSIMEHCQRLGKVSDEEAYAVWNMGNGMLCVSPDADAIVNAASKHGIEARVVGTVIDDHVIRVAASSGREIVYSL